jgi:short-subunit dehydrogenase involved in D-alanine esterification of teichoic acids
MLPIDIQSIVFMSKDTKCRWCEQVQRRMDDMNRLTGRTAVISGGATGIGRAAAAAVAELGPNTRAVKGSVSDEADLDRLYAAVKAEREALDIIFANAGAGSLSAYSASKAAHRNLARASRMDASGLA